MKEFFGIPPSAEFLADNERGVCYNYTYDAKGNVTKIVETDTNGLSCGFMTGSMHGITLRSIGIGRAEFNIGLTNLVYNICRYTILKRKEVCMG